MPAKGPLAEISRKKYGPRADDREQETRSLFESLASVLDPAVQITSDEKPVYPSSIKPHFPEGTHQQVKGRRGAVVGQGELKKIGFDPLFSLNHSCAMLRANICRLARRTWCTTKSPKHLLAHLMIYIDYHNTELIQRRGLNLSAQLVVPN